MHATSILVYACLQQDVRDYRGINSGLHLSLESGQSSLIIHSVKCIVIVKLNKWYIYSCYKRVNILRKREREIYINDIYVNDKICIYDNKKIGILIGANIIEWVF